MIFQGETTPAYKKNGAKEEENEKVSCLFSLSSGKTMDLLFSFQDKQLTRRERHEKWTHTTALELDWPVWHWLSIVGLQ